MGSGKKTLDDVIDDLYNGQTPSRIINSYWNGTINWLSSGELNRSIVKRTIEKISINGQKSANLRLVPSGTFVMAITGLEAVGTRGNCAMLGIDTTLNQSCMAIYPKKDLLNTSFLFHWYRKNSEEYGIKFTQGTKQQSYNASIIRKLDIVLPKINEQTKIGDYFQKLDKLIEQKEKKYQKLKQFKEAMLSKMFPKNGATTTEIRFCGFSGEWEDKSLGEVATFSKGQGYSKNDLVEFGTPIILYGRLYTKYQTTISEVDTFAIRKENSITSKGNEVVVPASGETAEDIARASAIKTAGLLIGGDLNIIYPKDEIDNIFLALSISNGETQKKLSKKAQGKSVVHLRNNDLKEVDLFYPSKAEQTKIGNYFQKLDKQIELQLQELEKLKNIKKASLAKMFV